MEDASRKEMRGQGRKNDNDVISSVLQIRRERARALSSFAPRFSTLSKIGSLSWKAKFCYLFICDDEVSGGN